MGTFASWLQSVVETNAKNTSDQIRDWERCFKGELTFDQWRASVNRQHSRNVRLFEVEPEESK